MADLCILYEVTNYKDESAEADFWDTYVDFSELGNDANLIRQGRLDTKQLDPKARAEYLAALNREANDAHHGRPPRPSELMTGNLNASTRDHPDDNDYADLQDLIDSRPDL